MLITYECHEWKDLFTIQEFFLIQQISAKKLISNDNDKNYDETWQTANSFA